MNITCKPQLSQQHNFIPRNKYLIPYCAWKSSTKAMLFSVLVENLRKVSELRSSMEITQVVFELKNDQSSHIAKLDSPLYFKALSIHKIHEIDESLSEDELYPQNPLTSSLDSSDCPKGTKKNDSLDEDPFLKTDSLSLPALTWSNIVFNEENDEASDEEKLSPKRILKKKATQAFD